MAKNSVKSATQDFSKVVHATTPRSTFKRNSTLVTTMNAGDLVPIYIDEILPGDTFKMDIQHVSRLLTPLNPTMDNITLEFFAFFVPNRIVWDNWTELQGENNSSAWTPAAPPASTPIVQTGDTVLEKNVGDYYGLPLGLDTGDFDINELPFRGYQKIWNDWFRNQNVQAPIAQNLGNGTICSVNDPLLKVNKPFDYFTSALPAPQKGVSQLIPIELNQLIPVITSATLDAQSGIGVPAIRFREQSSGNPPSDGRLMGFRNPVGPEAYSAVYTDVSGTDFHDEVYPKNLFADATGMTINGTTISDLRTAFQIQRLYERDARGGTRYIEMLKAHFGVDAGDYRLQRPEYLGHCSTMIDIHQVNQTAEDTTTDGTTPTGTTRAFGHSQGNDYLFNKSFVEHGFVHIFAVARQKKTYQQGLDRFWSRRDRLDYYVPVLAHISEQPIFTKEIYAFGAVTETTVFGYQEAWSDYRYKPNRVTGQMRTDATASFDIWHYADYYSNTPTLSNAWMQDNSKVNIQRTLAVEEVDQILLNVRFDLDATRPMPTHSIPGLIDHF